MTRTEPCTCGGAITAIVGEEPDGVAAHNATAIHRTWRAVGGMERDVHGPDVHVPAAAGVSSSRPQRAATWDPAGPQRALAAALATQQVVTVMPAGWVYRNGRQRSTSTGRRR